jgi:alpha-amylase
MSQKQHSIRTGILCTLVFLFAAGSCLHSDAERRAGGQAPFIWENATVYFLLTDRFLNGDPENDINFDRTDETAVLRGFLGGDLDGVTRKIEEGYFDELGVTALWLTPWFEQIHGSTDEGTGVTYGYHGYWARDFTCLDPNFGTEEDLARFVETAHAHGIRVVMDVIMNHTGPVTEQDPVWPPDWVRTSPPCSFQSYETTVSCTLVENLPDIRTGSDIPVDLPPFLLEKWDREGRLDQELGELESFFKRTGYPRAPRYYLIKWLTDFIRKYGIDGYRLDTAKHVEEWVWKELHDEAVTAFQDWKSRNPDQVLDNNEFYMVGEVYGYGAGSGRTFDYGDRKVDFFAESIHSLINMGFKDDAGQDYEILFSSYAQLLHGELEGHGILNYLTSHDDDHPFDPDRHRPLEAGTRLLLSPGSAQIYYGDESCRDLVIPGATGDASLRGPMNWEEIGQGVEKNGFGVDEVMEHYRKLGKFRRDHLSVGAGSHREISQDPYVFAREYRSGDYSDRIVAGLGLEPGVKVIPVGDLFSNGTELYDYYSDTRARVRNGRVTVDSRWDMVLLGKK